MPTDYAQRRTSAKPSRRRRPAAQPRRFSWGSFATGLVVGIAATLAGALLPEVLSGRDSPRISGVDATPVPSEPARPQPEFTFWDQLPSQQLPARSDGDRRQPSAASGEPAEEIEYLLQAGSFSRHEDAERLRASLLLLGLDANTATVTLPGGATRHRVLVGPFDSERLMRRAQTTLREQDIDPLPLRRRPNQAAAG